MLQNQAEASQTFGAGFSGKEKVVTPLEAIEHTIVSNESDCIHPDRISQVGNTLENNDNLRDSDSELGQASRVLKSGEEFFTNSKKQRKEFRKKFDPLTHTRSGKIPVKPLTKRQRSRLQAIPKDTISAYLLGRK